MTNTGTLAIPQVLLDDHLPAAGFVGLALMITQRICGAPLNKLVT